MQAGHTLAERYRLEAFLREGAGGPVWTATDLRQESIVAVELLRDVPASDPILRMRVREHIRSAAWPWFSDPHVVPVLNYAEDNGIVLASYALEHGETLATLLTRETFLSPRSAAAIAADVADAVEAGHRVGLIHGAIGPDVVLVADGPRGRLLDFGLSPASRDRSARVSGLGRPGASGAFEEAKVDDVGALGTLLSTMLGDTGPSTRSNGGGQPDSAEASAVAALARLAADAGSEDPGRRPPSAAAFAATVRAAAGQTAPTPVGPAIRPPPAETPGLLVVVNPLKGTIPAPPDSGRTTWSPRVAVAVVAGAVGVTLLAFLVVWVLSAQPKAAQAPSPPTKTGSAAQPATPVTGTVRIPKVAGLSAAEAERRLLHVGLGLSTVTPVAGQPGIVMRTEPEGGSAVRPGASVTLFVGAEAGRIPTAPASPSG
jgi:serine/threonine-protein kinase